MNRLAIRGLNHLTLAVADLERSLTFYRDLVGFRLRAIWLAGAYLEAGNLWLCLSVDPTVVGQPKPDYTHFAFDVEEADFLALADRVRKAAPLWRDNVSEGASLYVLDPDGHKLELHVGSLDSRLAEYAKHPPQGFESFDSESAM